MAFSPTATGARTTTLTIASNGPPLTSASITGTGRDLAVAGGPLDFSGRVGAAPAAGQTVTITNEDTADYALGAVTVSGGQANQFSKTADTCSSVTLAAGASCTIEVAFAPTSPGAKTSTLAIAGYGPAPVTLRGEARQPSTALAPATRRFADASMGAVSAPQTFTLTNTGAGPLPVDAVSLAGRCRARSRSCATTCAPGSRSPNVPDVRRRGRVRSGRARLSPRFAADRFFFFFSTVARLEGRGRGDGVDTVC